MRMKARTRNRCTPRMLQKTAIRLNTAQESPIHIEHADVMSVASRGENGGMFMHAECAECVARSGYGTDRLVHPDVPEFDFAVSRSRDKFAHSPTLHVQVCDPLFVMTPGFFHRCGRAFALVEDADCTVAVAGYEDVAGYLVGG